MDGQNRFVIRWDGLILNYSGVVSVFPTEASCVDWIVAKCNGWPELHKIELETCWRSDLKPHDLN